MSKIVQEQNTFKQLMPDLPPPLPPPHRNHANRSEETCWDQMRIAGDSVDDNDVFYFLICFRWRSEFLCKEVHLEKR